MIPTELERRRAMRRPTSRWLLRWLAGSLIVALVGCAARKGAIAPSPPAPTVAQEDRERCITYATHLADDSGSVDQPSIAKAASVGLVAAQFFLIPGVILFPVVAMIDAGLSAHNNESARKYAYRAAEEECLKPVILEGALGPEHPDVAAALRDLAIEYAYHEDYRAAQPLYRRALAIQERAFGPDSGDVATTLEWYAKLLRAQHRDEEAACLEARAHAIRDDAERDPGPAAA